MHQQEQRSSGKVVGSVLEELEKAGVAGKDRDSSMGWRGHERPGPAEPLCHSKAVRILISTLENSKGF